MLFACGVIAFTVESCKCESVKKTDKIFAQLAWVESLFTLIGMADVKIWLLCRWAPTRCVRSCENIRFDSLAYSIDFHKTLLCEYSRVGTTQRGCINQSNLMRRSFCGELSQAATTKADKWRNANEITSRDFPPPRLNLTFKLTLRSTAF